MNAEKTIDGMTYEQVHYNVYAFSQDVKRFTRKRNSARKAHTKLQWEKKLLEAQKYLANNQTRLQAFEETPGE